MKPFVKRLAWSAVVLVGITALTFALAFVVPSDPARTLAGPKADQQTLEGIRRELGLDRAVAVQYGFYVARLLRGDLGRSYVTGQRVRDAISERFPATAYLAAVSFLVAAVLGGAIGCWVAVHESIAVQVGVLVTSLVALSLPVFWVGLLLLDVVAYRWRLLPLGGYGGVNVIMPAATLALGMTAYYARVVQASVRGVLGEDYIRTAHAKGLNRVRVYSKHALRNALIPIVTLLGLDLAGLLSGVVLTETVFNWPGIGRLAVDAVFSQDIPTIMGTVLFGALLVVAANLAVDLLYLAIDPRMRRAGR